MIAKQLARPFGASIRLVRITIDVILALLLVTGMAQQIHAVNITWIGGNASWDASTANWNPADEPDADDTAIFNTPNSVSLALNNSVLGLTLSGGIDLNTSQNNLDVNGLVQLSDASTTLIVGGSNSLLTADSITINNGGTLRLTNGVIMINEESGNGLFDLNSGSTLTGNGVLNFSDAVAAGTILLINDGTITAASTTPGDLFGTSAATLTINSTDPDARVDLDGAAESGIVNVGVNDTLEINVPPSDIFNGTLNLGPGSTIQMGAAWIEGAFAAINANTANIISGTPGPAATIAGASFSMNSGTINLDAVDSLRFSAPFTANGGSISNAGHVIFNANSTIGTVASFLMIGEAASLTVETNAVVNIDDADFNLDGGAFAGNIVTINGGVLDLDLGTGADEALTGTINFNGGELDVTTLDNNWSIDGLVNVGANTGVSQINGEEVTITSATLTVGVNSTLDIDASTVWAAAGHLVVHSGAVARLDGAATFNSSGTFTGAGSLQIGGTANFITPTTIDMPNGTVDLDGGDIIGDTVTLNANTTINAGTMASFGNANLLGTNILEINQFAGLTVNLTDTNAEWTITSNAGLNIAAPGGMLAGENILGSDFNLAGTANISGNSLWQARTDISGTANVALNGSLNLRGGTLTDLNRLDGGTITGAGVLRALSNEGLAGFGTIDTDIEFANNTQLLADDGILNLTGPITDVGILGTADDDGILNVTTPWNTSTTDGVNLEGGEIRGALITNGGTDGITGDGLISARVINTTDIEAQNNGTLIIHTAANDNDWDGALGAGLLNARSGNLELRDNATFLFTGTVAANTGREVFANGFELEFEPGSTLTLNAGTYRSTNATDFAGAMSVSSTGDSTLQVGGTFVFENGSATTLNGNLRLNNPTTMVQPGADFTGSGALINRPTRTLRLLDGVVSGDLDVLIQNEGVLQLGAVNSDAQVGGADFQQAASGTLQIEIGGTALNAFDRFNLTGTAALSGELNLSLIGGFVPALGQTFNILTASSAISGTFTTVSQPVGMHAGTAFSVSYSPFVVQLTVTTPYEAWINSFTSLTAPADKLKTADPDNDGENNLVEFALDGNPTNALATGKVVVKVAPVSGVNALSLTFPVRAGATLDPTDPAGGPLVLEHIGDAVSYNIEASENLTNLSWTLDVTEVIGADAISIQSGLPVLNAGWVYRTFRSPGPVVSDPEEFMHLVIGE